MFVRVEPCAPADPGMSECMELRVVEPSRFMVVPMIPCRSVPNCTHLQVLGVLRMMYF